MASYRGLNVPVSMISQMKNVVVKKAIDLTDMLDRGSITEAHTSDDKGAGWRKDANGGGKSAVSDSITLGSITDTQIIEDQDFGVISVEVGVAATKSWKQRRRANRVFERARGGNS